MSADPSSSMERNFVVQDSNRIEAVTVCVGFDDLLDYTLDRNHGHFDNFIVVTSHDDIATQGCAVKHGATLVKTDLFKKNGRPFNKGAAINAGFSYFQYHGWRLHLDCDILLPDKFRQTLFNHTHLDTNNLYGADRVDVVGLEDIKKLKQLGPQHRIRFLVDPTHDSHVDTNFGGRFVGQLEGYVPLGFFQLWHYSRQNDYPYSLGNAGRDDTSFGKLWPRENRVLLPTIVCYHICPGKPHIGQNWDGKRAMPKLDNQAIRGKI